MKNWLIAGIVAVIAIGALACGSADSEPLSAEEYAALQCSGSPLTELVGLSVGELLDRVEARLDERDVTAPPQYTRFHAEWRASSQILRDWLAEQNRGDLFSLTALTADDSILANLNAASDAIGWAVNALSLEDAQLLRDAGCNI